MTIIIILILFNLFEELTYWSKAGHVIKGTGPRCSQRRTQLKQSWPSVINNAVNLSNIFL